MSKITVLDAQTAQSIAAGEVVERPASIVKELLENALDAGADRIQVRMEQGGIKLIQVIDNGHGMSHEDSILAFADHATSKIQKIGDLDAIQSFGFRGEALPTISAVSKVRLRTKTRDAELGSFVEIEGGKLLRHELIAVNPGTHVEIRDVFYNTPARFKFLKQDKTEAAKVTEVVQEMALSRPDVSFRLESQGREILHTPGDNRLISAIYAVFGQDIAKQMVPILDGADSMIQASGFISLPEFSKKSRTWQLFYVNHRPIKSPILIRAVEDAYKSTMMVGKFPACILHIQIPGNLVDVNVHPRKLEVRFWNESEVYKQIYHQVQNSLFSALKPNQVEEDTHQEIEPEIVPTIVPKPKEFLHFNLDGYAKIQDAQEAYTPASEVEATTQPSQPTEQLTFVSSEKEPVDDERLMGLKQARFAGELFRTYLLFEYQNFVYLIDQHAAHEKILFEKAVKEFKSKHMIASQTLLDAVEMEIRPSDVFVLEEEEAFIQAYGFDFSFIGKQKILIRAVPVGHEVLDPSRALRYLIDEIIEHGVEGVKGETDFIYHMLATSSCKAAVKAHDRLHNLEVEALLKDLLALENPFHCPHGRPILLELEEKSLEKLFKRIV